MEREPFSDQLERWLQSNEPKTLGKLGEVFGEKSFAVTVLLLMFLPAIPAPTAGVTHVFEVITVLIGAQMIIGAHTIWLPARWRDRELGKTVTNKAVPFIARTIRRFERFSRPRLASLYEQRWFLRILGLIVSALAVSAAFAPPFSGLDTLPALGVVLLSLGVLLEDFFVVVLSVIVGAAGVFLEVVLGKAALSGIRKLF